MKERKKQLRQTIWSKYVIFQDFLKNICLLQHVYSDLVRKILAIPPCQNKSETKGQTNAGKCNQVQPKEQQSATK